MLQCNVLFKIMWGVLKFLNPIWATGCFTTLRQLAGFNCPLRHDKSRIFTGLISPRDVGWFVMILEFISGMDSLQSPICIRGLVEYLLKQVSRTDKVLSTRTSIVLSFEMCRYLYSCDEGKSSMGSSVRIIPSHTHTHIHTHTHSYTHTHTQEEIVCET